MQRKNYVFDIDGTIAVNGQKVAADLTAKLVELAKQHQLIFASARPVRDMLPMLDPALHDNALWFGCNGAMAYQKGQFLFAETIPTQPLQAILTFLKAHQQPYVLDGKWGFSLSATSHPFHQYILSLSPEQWQENDLVADGISKVLVLSNDKKAEICALAGENLAVHTHKNEDIFDITPKGNNKYYALKRVIGDQPYIAFGNDQNDFLMLDNAAFSVFIGDPTDYQNADLYTQTSEIAEWLGRFALNNP